MLARKRVLDLSDFVSRSSDLNHLLLDLHASKSGHSGGILALAFALFACGSSCKVRLVFAALGVGKVGTVILVDSETKSALETSDVVLEEVGVFVEVDRFQCELAQTLTTVGVGCGLGGDTSTAKFGSCTILRQTLVFYGLRKCCAVI